MGSFFFWLDLISTISVVLDIEVLFQFIIHIGRDNVSSFNDISFYKDMCQSQSGDQS